MASTSDLCKTIRSLGGNPEALKDKKTKTLSEEIIRLLSIGSVLDLDAEEISYDETTVDAQLDTLVSRVPTSAEVLSAIEAMTADQIAAVKTKLGIQ